MNLAPLRPFIGGRYVDPVVSASYPDLNPATGEMLTEVHPAGAAEVEAAVAAARAGFEVWSAMPGAERARVLRRAASLLRERNEELARLETLDTGKPIQETTVVDILSGAECLEFCAALAATLHGEHITLANAFAYTRREPLGVCLGIGAWNYPMQIACWKSAPALACGNAMIFKPSELTPMTALKLAEIYAEAGLPDGVFNVLPGHRDLGAALVAHPGIDKVSLTGSVAAGQAVMASAAATLKHVTMELGGKSPLIVFADADLDNAVSATLLANFYSQGEVCSNGTRVFVEASIREAFTERLVARTRALRIGDPLDPTTEVGPQISAEHLARVLDYVHSGQQEGARLLCGGVRHSEGVCATGHYVEPAIFTDCHDGMRIVREEIFGPVLTLLGFDSEEEVIARANATELGLAAGVFTRDLARAHRVVARLQAGTCWVNNYNITPIEMPFGGVKLSGIGRENGIGVVEHYTQRKAVYVELGDVACPYR